MDRRKFIVSAGGIVFASQAPIILGGEKPAAGGGDCRPTVRQTPGPYGLPDSPLRIDVREDRPGVPLRLEVEVISNMSCQPAEGCYVDIWQCDAGGLYSGVDNIVFDEQFNVTADPIDQKDETYLRGHQMTDENGIAVFETVYPGWYFPRLAHIHVRALVPGIDWTTLDTQIYFPLAVEQEIYKTKHYEKRGPNPMDAARDAVIKGDMNVLQAQTVKMKKHGQGFVGHTQIALDII